MVAIDNCNSSKEQTPEPATPPAARGPMRAEDAKKGLREAAKLGQAEVAAGLLTGCVQRKVQLDQDRWLSDLLWRKAAHSIRISPKLRLGWDYSEG